METAEHMTEEQLSADVREILESSAYRLDADVLEILEIADMDDCLTE